MHVYRLIKRVFKECGVVLGCIDVFDDFWSHQHIAGTNITIDVELVYSNGKLIHRL